MKVSFTGCSLTKVTDDYIALLPQLECIGSTGSLRDLGCQGTRDGHKVVFDGAIVYGHLLALSWILAIAEALIHKFIQSESSVEQYTGFPVLSIDDVLMVECCCRANVCCLFSGAGHVKGNTTLSLGIVQNVVHDRQGEHVLVHFDALLVSQLPSSVDLNMNMSYLGIQLVIGDSAFGVHDPKGWHWALRLLHGLELCDILYRFMIWTWTMMMQEECRRQRQEAVMFGGGKQHFILFLIISGGFV